MTEPTTTPTVTDESHVIASNQHAVAAALRAESAANRRYPEPLLPVVTHHPSDLAPLPAPAVDVHERRVQVTRVVTARFDFPAAAYRDVESGRQWTAEEVAAFEQTQDPSLTLLPGYVVHEATWAEHHYDAPPVAARGSLHKDVYDAITSALMGEGVDVGAVGRAGLAAATAAAIATLTGVGVQQLDGVQP